MVKKRENHGRVHLSLVLVIFFIGIVLGAVIVQTAAPVRLAASGQGTYNRSGDLTTFRFSLNAAPDFSGNARGSLTLNPSMGSDMDIEIRYAFVMSTEVLFAGQIIKSSDSTQIGKWIYVRAVDGTARGLSTDSFGWMFIEPSQALSLVVSGTYSGESFDLSKGRVRLRV